MSAGRAALFLDRDGTIIEDAHYVSDGRRVRLLPGTAQAIAAANTAKVPVVIVTNQSGIARGLITRAEYEVVRARMEHMLAAHGAHVDASFHCPHSAEAGALACGCRKPALGMYREAAKLHHLDLSRSAYIGDRWTDVEPSLTTGGLGLLVPGAETSERDIARARVEARVHPDLESAVNDALQWIAQHAAVTVQES